MSDASVANAEKQACTYKKGHAKRGGREQQHHGPIFSRERAETPTMAASMKLQFGSIKVKTARVPLLAVAEEEEEAALRSSIGLFHTAKRAK